MILSMNPSPPKRIAFILPEFLTEHPTGGGLESHMVRVAKLLIARGHAPEIFVASQREPRELFYEGIRVNRVPLSQGAWWAKLIGRMLAILRVNHKWKTLFGNVAKASALANALERRHHDQPFDIVQSADYDACGLCVRRKRGRVFLLRCSVATDLYHQVQGPHHLAARWQEKLEQRSLRRAEAVYSPSIFIAKHFRERHGIPTEVVRPPISLEVEPATAAPVGLPEKFLVYFGHFIRRKGIYWLAASLRRAFEIEPALRMVWVGRGDFAETGNLLATLGEHRFKVLVLYPLPKRLLYAVVQRAEASVMPTLMDNVPNTVIESLMLGIPVIGPNGVSVDELVTPGVNGELVAMNDIEALAQAMVRVWRGESTARKGFVWQGGVAEEMQADYAIESLLQFAEKVRSRQ
jgi:glycosyltransferase involved in cell wall biosynthesis